MGGTQREVVRRFAWLWVVGILWAGAPCPAVFASAEESSKQEQALRTRVEEFYNFLQQGQWFQAEPYLTEDSREPFQNQWRSAFMGSKPFVGFKVESAKLDPDGQNATAVVRLLVFTQFSAEPAEVPRTSRWRLVNNIWYLVFPKADPNAQNSLFNVKNSRPAKAQPEQLKFKGHRYGFGIVQPGEIKTSRFPFTNVTDHLVKLAAVLTSCECLRVKTTKSEYKPGESGELVIEFDPTGYEQFYYQTIVVKTDPGDVKTLLDIEAYVTVQRETPKTEGESKPAKKPS